MVGGQSSRMGTDKGLMNFDGKPMIQYAIDLLKSIFSEVLISSNNHEYQQFNLNVIHDIYKNCGPIGGLHSALYNISAGYVFIISCDMPFMKTEIIKQLFIEHENFDIIIPKIGDKIEPLCAVYSKRILPHIEDCIKNKRFKMYDFIKTSHTKYVAFTDKQPFFNINSLEDLSKPYSIQ